MRLRDSTLLASRLLIELFSRLRLLLRWRSKLLTDMTSLRSKEPMRLWFRLMLVLMPKSPLQRKLLLRGKLLR